MIEKTDLAYINGIVKYIIDDNINILMIILIYYYINFIK